jgi:hypothetical protein
MEFLWASLRILAVILLVLAHSSCRQSAQYKFLDIAVFANGFQRIDKPVTIKINRSDFINGDSGHVKIVEIDENRTAIDSEIVYQIDWDDNNKGSGELVFLMQGILESNASRHYRIFFHPNKSEPPNPNPSKFVSVEKIGHYEGDDTYRITTRNTSYFYHVNGSGFASMIDADGNDWISYHPTVRKVDGPKGAYRGIPNLWNAGFHPGQSEGKKPSKIISNGPVRASILSQTDDGEWKCTWNIYPEYATMTLLKRSRKPYWFLYEGTPGGEFNLTDYWVFSNGQRNSFASYTADNMWNKPIPSPKWVYFGDISMKRILFIASHHDHRKDDQIWHFGEGTMTVFGFGRGEYGTKNWQQLKKIPGSYTIGFLENNEFTKASRAINSAYRPLKIDTMD